MLLAFVLCTSILTPRHLLIRIRTPRSSLAFAGTIYLPMIVIMVVIMSMPMPLPPGGRSRRPIITAITLTIIRVRRTLVARLIDSLRRMVYTANYPNKAY